MKKILLILFAILWHYIVYAENLPATLNNHTATGTYGGWPVYIVGASETLSFAQCGYFWHLDGESILYNSNYYCGQKQINTSTLSTETLHQVKIRNYYSDNTYYCYLIIITPSQTTCSKTSKQITIWWRENISRWERSYDGGSTWTNIACTSYKYTESNPSAGTAKYRVLGTDNTYSDVVTITYVDAVPSTIQATPATNTKTVDESITLTANVTDNGYKYQWKKNGTDISGATKRTYTISKVKSSHAGNYTCYISNGCNGVTSTTAKLTVNKCAQVIDFPEIPVQTYSSGLTYTLPKTTNKGLTITYQSMNTSVATVSGNVLTIKAPGTAIISASQVGNADYLEATQVSRTLTVNKRSQVITFGELPEKTYEDLPFTLPQKTNEGLTISYTSTNTAVATVSGNTVTILKPGSTDIIASQAGDATHYAAAQVSQTLVVKKAAQEITFGTLSSKTYGDAPFELTKVSNKNLTIAYTSSDASIASIVGNVVTINHPGTVTITASQSGNAYYLAAESISQTLTIKKADQSINFPALESRAYDSGDFNLAAKTDKGETITYTSSNPSVATVSGNKVHITGTGTTDITATQAGNEYYNAAPTVSQTLTITKAYQTINFPEIPACTYGQTSIELNATVNSDSEIEYESSNYSVATISGNILTIVGAGQCYITASAAGNKNYYTATPVERALVVAKAQPTLTFAQLASEYTYGDTPIALVASGNSGSVSFTSSNPSKLPIVGTNAVIQGAGKFSITASLAENANYKAASISQEITVNKANLTITANNVSREYGENNPQLMYTYKGFVNGDSKSDLTATIQISSAANILSQVGNYEIVVEATTDDNYEIACKKGVLTIEKASLIISTNCTREYGENNPEFVLSYTGFKNNENSSVLSAQPVAYTTAKKSSPVGSYPIYISGAEATNYSLVYKEGSLTVTQAPLTIKALDVTRKRLEENPKFELSFTGFKLEDTKDDLEKLPTIQCEATINSPAGTYPIVLLTDGYATNYKYTLINGTLTIEKLKYTISVKSQDETKGTVSGGGTYDEEETITISAIPQPHHNFTKWNDGNTSASRAIKVIQDASYIAYFAIDRFKISVISSDEKMGSVSGGGEFDYGAVCKITASAYEGYHFTQWSDGNTQNPRNIIVTEKAVLKAIFAKNIYTIKKNVNTAQGTIDGPSQAEYLDFVTLTAVPNYGYHFTQWSDGVKDNPRSFTITRDTTFAVEFEVDRTGQCGNNLALTWTYYPEKKVLTIEGNGAFEQNIQCGVEARSAMTTLIIGEGVTKMKAQAFSDCQHLTSVTWKPRSCSDLTACPFPTSVSTINFSEGVVYIPAYLCKGLTALKTIIIPTSVTAIGNYAFANINNRQFNKLVLPSRILYIGAYAFAGNTYLEEIDFGQKLMNIGSYAFQNCSRVTTMTCLAEVTPDVGTNALSSISSNAILYVQASVIQKYKADSNWSRFFIKELGATETTTGNVVIVESTDNTATFTWPMTNNAGSYTLLITKDGEVFCTLTFNENGQLLGIAFAPSLNSESQVLAATISNSGMSFTVTGLNSASKYVYSLTTADGNDNMLVVYHGEFATTGYEGVVNPGGEPEVVQTINTVSDTNETQSVKVIKFIKNGQLFIQRDGKTYSITGQKVE